MWLFAFLLGAKSDGRSVGGWRWEKTRSGLGSCQRSRGLEVQLLGESYGGLRLKWLAK